MPLYEDVMALKANPEIKAVVDGRISEFLAFKSKPWQDWFSELCYCIMTANNRAQVCMGIQDEVGNGFIEDDLSELVEKLKCGGHRFYNMRAGFIIDAREYWNVKGIISEIHDPLEAREWLMDNIKGLGYKEASHFLRNTGTLEVAILDRHILRRMLKEGLVEKLPSSLSRRFYLETEQSLRELADRVGETLGSLDLYLWYMETSTVLK